MAERYYPKEEDKSLWKSRLFKGGVVAAIAGAVLSSAALMAVGAIAMGGAWALMKGRK